MKGGCGMGMNTHAASLLSSVPVGLVRVADMLGLFYNG